MASEPLPDNAHSNFLDEHGFEYDLIVVGGGSGGLACAKQAAAEGAKVCVFDYIKPSPQGTTWGLGGTCVNVGCIPKKLMHQGALLGESFEDSQYFGWKLDADSTAEPVMTEDGSMVLPFKKPAHDWNKLVENVQNHIMSLNFAYRVQLREKGITYINAYASFVDAHTVEWQDRRAGLKRATSRRFVIAVGGRPSYPDIPGAKEYGISSDDLFSLSHAPGRVCVVGASYVALECAGFLNVVSPGGATVLMRSIPLRGFDQDCASRIVQFMEEHGVQFKKGYIPDKIEKHDDGLHVFYSGHGETHEEVFDTVLFAIGRFAVTEGLNLPAAGVNFDTPNKKIIANAYEQTNVPHIYAIGDVLYGKLELTPVAIQAGKLLAKRLFGGSSKLMDYINVPTTVFTPIEYGSCGYSEEDAIAKFGADNLVIYRTAGTPLEWTIAKNRAKGALYFKLICNAQDDERVIGFHVLSPNAAEITQGVAIAMRCGARKVDFDDTVGIHPSIAELLTTITTTEITESGGCST